jgi:hypothetical protein
MAYFNHEENSWGSRQSRNVDWSPSAVAKSGILTAQYRHFKPFGEILLAKALAISIVGSPKVIKSDIVAGKNSQFLAVVENLAPCEACIRRSHTGEHEKFSLLRSQNPRPPC